MNSSRPFLLVLFFMGTLSAVAQKVKNIQDLHPNLVPNHSFEEFSGVPLGWFYNGSQFTRLVKYWNSPTLASPDAFGPGIIVPTHWQKKGFGKISPLSGSAMAGITVYGCSVGKPHCKEYIQVHLNENLVHGQTYELSVSLAHLEKSLMIDKIGAFFTIESMGRSNDGIIEADPQVFFDEIIIPQKGQWKTMTKSFVADQEYNYMTVGNFFADSLNDVLRKQAIYEFAYYYLDEIKLKKVPPFVEQKVPDDDLTLQPLEVGRKIQLKNIYFDLDKSDLLPRSFVELNKLQLILLQNPSMTIEIHGHTDMQGESDYNVELSIQRSKSVMQYLLSKGISSDRIIFRGYGSNMPIADNAEASGRKLNRRVEILITGL